MLVHSVRRERGGGGVNSGLETVAVTMAEVQVGGIIRRLL